MAVVITRSKRAANQAKGFTVNQRRTLILVGAIIIGALGSFLVWNYVSGLEDKALGDAEQVDVFLVKQTIPRGMSAVEASALIAKEQIPRKFKPQNSITDVSDISGQVAISDLVANQVVVNDMFVDPSNPAARRSFADRIDRIRGADQVAITVEVSQVRGVAHLIKPGDFVNVMISKVSEFGPDGEPVGVPEGMDPDDVLFAAQARYLYQKVEVLAVGHDAVPTPTGSAAAAGETEAPATTDVSSGLVTLIVPARAAQYIASVAPENIYLVMVARDYVPTAQSTIDIAAILPAENANELTPYGPEGPEED